MKKRPNRPITLLLGILMLTTALAAFASCDKGDKGLDLHKLEGEALADAIYDISAKEYLEDCVTETEEIIKGTLYGATVEYDTKTEVTYIGQTSDAPIFHAESELCMKLTQGNITETHERKHIQGFRDGQMYTDRDDDGEVVSLVADMTYAEYKALRQSLLPNTPDEVNAAFKSASVKSAEQKEDGTWVIVFSGYTKENLRLLIKNNTDEGVYMFEGYQPSDMKMTAVITEDHKPVSVSFEILFEMTDEDTEYDMPSSLTTLTVKEFGSATAKEVDLSGYTEVADLAPLYTVQRRLSDLNMNDTLTFTSEATADITYAGNRQTTEVTEVVKAEVKDGQYTFAITQTQSPDQKDESVIHMAYEDGRLTVSGIGIPTQSQTLSENEARLTVDRMFDPGSITSGLVSDIQPGKNGYDYVLTVHDPDYSTFEQSFESLDAENYRAAATVSVKLRDGQITEYRYDFTLTATVSRDTLKVELVTVIRFGQTEIGEGSSVA